jgi:hypothetical protein
MSPLLAHSGHALVHANVRDRNCTAECLLMMPWTAPARRHRSAIGCLRQSQSDSREVRPGNETAFGVLKELMTDYAMVGACRVDPDSRQRRDRANAAYRNVSRLDCYESFLRGEISICGARLNWLHRYWQRAARRAPAKRVQIFNDRDSLFLGNTANQSVRALISQTPVTLSSRNVCGKPRRLSETKTSGAHGPPVESKPAGEPHKQEMKRNDRGNQRKLICDHRRNEW